MPHIETTSPEGVLPTFDWTAFGVVTAIVIGIAAIAVTVIVTRRFGNRRAVLTWFKEMTPLIPNLAEASHLEVTYRSMPIHDPILVTVVLFNSGPRDITSDMFDDGRPIRIDIGAEFYGVTRADGGAKLELPAIGVKGKESAVLIRPRLLKRGQSWSFSAVVSGSPEVRLNDLPLANTDEREILPVGWGGTIWSAFGEALMDVATPFEEVLSTLIPRRRN